MKKYNPNIHNRRSIRLKGYDYSQAGMYYITICCQDRICRFGHVENDEMILNEYGQMAHDEWLKLPERFAGLELDVFQIMPNHIYKSKNEIMGKLWQRNYYEHIIRNEKSYLRISDYIINNPAKWTDDQFYSK